MHDDQQKRRRRYVTRSRTGCRTCRLRHKKCDETPIACLNCTSNGWECEGYEVARLPFQKGDRYSIATTPSMEFCWAMTSDEKRCVSFFLHRTVASLTSFYDSPLWQSLVFQMCCTEPAVYHAVVALSAVNQDLERYGIPMPGSDTDSNWHRFALEQCMRSFALLNKRHISQDPQLPKVLLVCCLLFVMLELVLGHYDNATVHLQSGMAILKEMKIRRHTPGTNATVEDGLLEAFLHLEAQASQHGVLDPALHLDDEILYDERYEACLFEFGTVADAQRALWPLFNAGIRFPEECWSQRVDELVARYGELQAKQQRFLSCLFQFGARFRAFHQAAYDRLTPRAQRGADTLRLTYRALDITIRSCLMTGINLEPVWLRVDYRNLYAEVVAVMDRFQDRPPMMIETGVCPPLFTIATHCPDWAIRMRAVDALRSWQHCEGYMRSNLVADMVVEAMKAQLRKVWSEMQASGCPAPALVSFVESDQGVDAHISDGLGDTSWSMPLEPDRAFIQALCSITTVRKWPGVRASGILPE
ncbi:Zn(II)2Cys6 transcription factor [Aspergillus mulundensis]|uniref:Zn(2)-C6 fungal-type domain-containing protein n=1 Tax=Aspergillus mulundensis TaxID=1810919 RepID=A0A3D8QV32_9EURO|nr:hypothetical protein DSM5745_09371 [Aspergillus mulundensis]RDW65632.1 hypothetical protein DSM5745_09371 [Aspergillus mulundensis]